MGHAGDEAGHHEHPVIRREDREQVAHHQKADEQEDEAAARELAGKGRNQGRTDHYAECVGGNQRGGGILRNPEVLRDQRQQAHRDELGSTDSKRTKGHRHHDDGAARGRNLRLAGQRPTVNAMFMGAARA